MAAATEVRLREVVDEDLPVFFEHQRDPVAARMAAFASRDRDAFMAHWTKIMADDSGMQRTVVVDAQVVGNVMSFEHEGRREVGYWIGREHWGKGIATRALAEFLRHDRSRPLYAGVVRHNVGSIRVLEKCGFVVVDERDEMGDEVLLVLR